MHLPEPVTSVLDATLEYVYSFGPIASATVVLVPDFVRSEVLKLSESIGFDVDTLNMVLGLFLCYPLGMIMNMLPYGPIRHFFSFISGAFLMQAVIGVQWVHQMITSLAVYAMFLVLDRKTASRVVPWFVVIYCTLGHLHRQYINYLGWDMDFTGFQMVLTQKLYMMAFNLYDGELLAKGSDNKAAKKCSRFALKELPNILEFLGYTFCFSSIIAGPAYEFSIYNDACCGHHKYTPDGKPRGNIPSNVWPTLRPLLTCLLNMGIFVVLGGMFPLLDPEDPQQNTPVILTEEFLQNPWWYRYGYMWIALFAIREKYYFAWKNAEGSNNCWYAGFEGFDDKGNPKGWENSSNVNIPAFELAPNISTLSREWNKKTSLWLNRYMYIRTNGSLLAVYSLSAFWHGFYPGYYLFFLSVPLATTCERLGRKKISPNFGDSFWYRVVCTFCTSLVVEYMVSSFILLALDRAWANWKQHHFFGHILCVVFYLIVSRLPTPGKKEKTQ